MENMSQRDRDWENIERYAKAPHDLPIKRRLVELRDRLDSLVDRIDRWTESTENDLRTHTEQITAIERRCGEWAGPYRTLAHEVLTLRTLMTATQGRLREMGSTAPTPAPSIEPPELSDGEAYELFAGPGPEGTRDLTCRIHRAGWDAAMAAVAAQQQRPDIFPTEYADTDGDGIRIVMEPSEEKNQACWVVRNSRHVNPCREFDTPEQAFAAHQSAPREHSADHTADASKMVEPSPAPTPEPVPAEQSLRKRVAAIFAEGTENPPQEYDYAATQVMEAFADWVAQRNLFDTARILRQEATR
jgi:hypothetical protein